jgi:RNA polymerase sigma-70 factor (ECF subfamily)
MDITVTLRKQATAFNNGRQALQAYDAHAKEFAVNNEYASYEQLIAPIENRMIRSIWRIVRDGQEAEDTLQDALTIIWRKINRIRKHPNPQALILKICIDASYDSLRKRKHKHGHEDPETLGRIPANTTAASDEIVGKETENEILDAIAKLPRKQAAAVLMRIVQEQPYESIAQAMGCAETTVRIHVSRGREKLSRMLAHLKPIPTGHKEVTK